MIAPIAAALFGIGGLGSAIPPLILGLGILVFLGAGLGLHTPGRLVFKRLQP